MNKRITEIIVNEFPISESELPKDSSLSFIMSVG